MKKILLIEDDEILGRMYQKLFAFEGYSVDMATNGIEGFEKAQKLLPDLILLDVMMPRLNGIRLLKKLKSSPATQNTTVILLTNLGIQKELEKALKNGAARYIIKSDNDPKQVFVMVKEILDKTNRQIAGRNKINVEL